MTYSFDIDVAKEYGVNAAIMIKNFQFWIMKHRAEEKNFYDGRYWTYNSVRGWTELFCFWTPNQIRTILDSLVEKGVLKKGNYNPTPYDRTLWYAFVDEEKWIGSKSQIDLGNFTNEFVENHQPIPDIKPDNKPDIKPDNIHTTTAHARETPAGVVGPTLDEVLSYAKSKNEQAGAGGYKISQEDAEKFFTTYAKSGWKIHNQFETPIRDWKVALRGWARECEKKVANKKKSSITYSLC